MSTPIDRKKAQLGYIKISLNGRSCRICAHAQAQPTGRLNCTRGGFWVAPINRCNQFDQEQPK